MQVICKHLGDRSVAPAMAILFADRNPGPCPRSCKKAYARPEAGRDLRTGLALPPSGRVYEIKRLNS